MSCYNYLVTWYDSLTGDVPYAAFADFYEAEFKRSGSDFCLLLDLCCGTGTLTWELAARGYEMIAVDASVDMLIQAQNKSRPCAASPLFLCQDAAALDLYGTVDAAICSLDGLNYVSPAKLPEVFRRLHLFVRPGGLVIFDIRTPEFLRSLDGDIFVDEMDDVLCLWRADFDETLPALIYGMDIFSRESRLWRRESEEHIEYAHTLELLSALLAHAGFHSISFRTDCPQGDAGRMFVVAQR